MDELLEIEKIKQLKYRYFRLLDMKQFEELVSHCTEDVTTAYDNGRNSFSGRAELLEFFTENMPKTMYHQHQGHHPEITIVDDSNATGIWHFEDTVLLSDQDMVIRGTGIYWDEYQKQDGQWLIKHTGYERLWCTMEPYHQAEWRQVRGFFDAEERELSRSRPKTPGEAAFFGGIKIPAK